MATWEITDAAGIILTSSTSSTINYNFPKNTSTTSVTYTVKVTGDSGCVTETTYTVPTGSTCQATTGGSSACTATITYSHHTSSLDYINLDFGAINLDCCDITMFDDDAFAQAFKFDGYYIMYRMKDVRGNYTQYAKPTEVSIGSDGVYRGKIATGYANAYYILSDIKIYNSSNTEVSTVTLTVGTKRASCTVTFDTSMLGTIVDGF